MGRRYYLLWLSLFLLASLGAIAGLMLFVTPGDDPDVAQMPTEKTPPQVPTGPRRLPIGGSDSHHLVVESNGATYLVAPDGTRKLIVPARGPDLTAITEAKVKNKITPERRSELGQLIVCDEGVVDVPKDAVITFVGKDRVTVLNLDGSSTNYFVNGRSEHWSRDQKHPSAKKQ